MRKFLSLMLSATLVLGSVLTSYAAPLAKKLGANATTAITKESLTTAKARKAPRTKLIPQRSDIAKPGTVKLEKIQNKFAAQNRAALRSATTGQRAVTKTVNLLGQLNYSDAWYQTGGVTAFGIHQIPKTDSEDFVMYGNLGQKSTSGYDDGQGHYYSMYYITFWGLYFAYVYVFDTETWQQIGESTSVSDGLIATDICYDQTTGKVYGCYFNDNLDGYVWGEGDYINGTRTAISGTLSDYFMSVGCDKDGQFYAVTASGKFGKVNKFTGDFTEIGETGLDILYEQSGTFDDVDGVFLTTFNTDTDAGLAEIDIETGEATVLTHFPNNELVQCLYITKQAAGDKAPAAPSIDLSCENGSMNVTVTVTMPETLFDGTKATGQLFSYTVLNDDKVVMSGSLPASSVVSRSIAVAEPGLTTFEAYASNSDGDSPKAKASVYVGKGVPSAPSDVTLVWADGTATLTWAAVTTAADEGYLNPESVTYSVYDADGNVVSENQSATTYVASVAEPAEGFTTLQYSVVAKQGDRVSEASASNIFGLGAYTPAVSFDLTDKDVYTLHTVEDANNDGSSWIYTTDGARYTYNGTNDGDDWLFSPNVRLQAGKAYVFNVTTRSQSSWYPEKLEVCYGKEANADSMKDVLIEATELTEAEAVTLTAIITPEADGVYHIGLHAVSDADQYYLFVTDYSIGSATTTSAPTAVQNLKFTPVPAGTPDATISFTNPTTTLAGNTLSGDVTVKVYRNDELVKTLTGAAGAAQSFSDSAPAVGTYTYKFVPFNAAGNEGQVTTVEQFMGPATPNTPDNVALYETSTAGTYYMSWDPVTTAEDGSEILASNVTYNVYATEYSDWYGVYPGDKLNSEPITDTHYTIVDTPQDEQTTVYYIVQAVNIDVEGGYYYATAIGGPAYTMPVEMSGDTESLNTYYLSYSVSDSYVSVGLWSDSDIEGLTSSDNDNAYFYYQFQYLNSWAELHTGKIHIEGDHPVFKFKTMNIADDDTNEITVYAKVDGQEVKLLDVDKDDLNVLEWTTVKVDLSAYVGKDIQLSVKATCQAYTLVLLDDFKIFNDFAYDLSAAITAPGSADTDTEFKLTATITNEGYENSGKNYSVDLIRDGQLVDSKNGVDLGPDESGEFVFTQKLGLDSESAKYKVVVSYEADLNEDNNESEEVTVNRNLKKVAGVTNLTGEATDNGVALSWDPVVKGALAPVYYTEDFEECDTWTQEVEGWTFYDGDDSPVGGSEINFPDITIGTTKVAFFVVDSSDEDVLGNYAGSFTAYSGDLYIATMFRYDGGQADDWAISPELTGDAQRISFFAKSYSATYTESVNVYYSTTDTNISSFKPVEDADWQDLPQAWTEYSAKLPEGAKYFAIHSYATDAFMLMVDYVTYKCMKPNNSNLLGYNVYRDGQKINSELLTSANYTDTTTDGQGHTYNVTAVYSEGESEFSNSVSIPTSGIELVKAGKVNVSVDGKYIVVSGADNSLVTINAVDGKTLYSATGNARVHVNSAIYLVTVDRKTVKVIVR
jgi:hypothetical protein